MSNCVILCVESHFTKKEDRRNMKAIGIVRKIDSLGRIVVPMELRNLLDISEGDPIEIFIEDDRIILKKYSPSCIFCESTDNLTLYKGKLICPDCIKDLSAE